MYLLTRTYSYQIIFYFQSFPLRSEEILRAMLPSGISHTSIHRLVGKVIDPYLEAEEKQMEEVYEAGVIPESEVRWSI